MTAETGQLPPNRFVYVREETWLATEARLAAAERVITLLKEWDTLEASARSGDAFAVLDKVWEEVAAYEKAYSDKGDWIQKSEWVDPILKDVLSGKRKPPDLNSVVADDGTEISIARHWFCTEPDCKQCHSDARSVSSPTPKTTEGK